MEHTLGVTSCAAAGRIAAVLILVLVEHTLGEVARKTGSCGWLLVLILVLVEHTLGESNFYNEHYFNALRAEKRNTALFSSEIMYLFQCKDMKYFKEQRHFIVLISPQNCTTPHCNPTIL